MLTVSPSDYPYTCICVLVFNGSDNSSLTIPRPHKLLKHLTRENFVLEVSDGTGAFPHQFNKVTRFLYTQFFQWLHGNAFGIGKSSSSACNRAIMKHQCYSANSDPHTKIMIEMNQHLLTISISFFALLFSQSEFCGVV